MEIEKEIKEVRKINHQQAKEIVNLREELKELRKENEDLKKRLGESEGEEKPEDNQENLIKDPVKKRSKKTGQKKGHKGYSRHVPERIDEVKALNPNECPDCGNELSGTQEVRTRVITDIEIKTKNTKYFIYRKYCKPCGKIVEPEVEDALPNARFSLRFMLLVMLMKVGLKMPSNDITGFFKMFSLEISDGEIYNILDKLKEEFGDYYNELVKKMREAAHKNTDESSWRMDGLNYWIWNFINKEVALYVIDKKRSSEVPIRVLGNQEGKSMTRDRFSAYNVLAKKTGCLQQVCWTHLLRNANDLAEHYSEARYIRKRLKFIFRKANEGESKEKLLHWIDLIGSRTYTSTEVFKFVKSICRKHREDLFRFVDNPEISATNNLAERGLRHPVVMRKISGGSRSEKGADTTAKLLSVVQTVKMQEGNIMDNLVNILQKGK